MGCLVILVAGVSCTNRSPKVGKLSLHLHNAGIFLDDYNGQITIPFRYQNATSTRQVIREISKSCNCSQVDVSAREVNPGEFVDVKLVINPMKSKGKYRVLATLKLDDKDTGPSFAVEYSIFPKLVLEPNCIDLAVAPSFENAEAVKKTISLERFELVPGNTLSAFAEPETILLEGHAPIEARLALEPPVVSTLEHGRVRRTRYRVDISCKSIPADLAFGPHSTAVTVKLRDSPPASFVVIWRNDHPLCAAPNPISFGYLGEDKSSAFATVILTSRDRRPFRILSCDSGIVRLDSINGASAGGALETGSDPRHRVVLKLCRSELTRVFTNGSIRFRTDHPKQPEIMTAWSAILHRE
jgi:Protein of unknown function (DUF1573)